jgi:peptidyl-prolyl cis-trans isomerase C
MCPSRRVFLCFKVVKGQKMRSFLFNSKVLTIVVVFFAVCGLSCKQKSSEQADTNIPQQPAQNKIEAETKPELETKAETTTSVESTVPEDPFANVAVTVNGIDISEEELQKVLQPQLARMAQQNQKLPPGLKETLEKQFRQQILDQLIIRQLLEEKAKETNIVISEEDVINQIKQLLASQGSQMSLEQFKQTTAESGRSFDEIKKQVEKGMVYQKIVDSQWAGKINITEEDAKKHYDENPTQFVTKEQVRASHILLTPKTDVVGADPNQEKAKAKTKAESLLKQIKEGADFAALAKANSHCPSSAQGGDLGFFPRGKMAAPFEKAAFALETGKVSDLVETRFGYHIIKVTDRKEAGTTTFDQAKAGLIKQLAQKQQAELTNKYIDSLKAAAKIVYPPGKEPKASPSPMMVPQSR